MYLREGRRLVKVRTYSHGVCIGLHAGNFSCPTAILASQLDCCATAHHSIGVAAGSIDQLRAYHTETLQTRPSTSASMHHSRGRYRTWSGWSMSGSTTEVVQRTEGTLGIDIVDRARNQLVWESAASQRVTESTRQNQAEVLDVAVAEIFAKFP